MVTGWHRITQYLTKTKRPELVIASIRLIKSVLALKEISIQSSCIECGLFDSIITVFTNNGKRYNLINSSILDLFNFIVQNIHIYVKNNEVIIKQLTDRTRKTRWHISITCA